MNIIQQKGIAADFAQGTKFVESKYHLEDFAMHVKGQDFAGYDPRAFRGFALSYGVSPEGPSHLRSAYHGIEIKMPNRLEYENKVVPMIEQEDMMTIIDSLIVCKFIRGVLDHKIITEIYNSIYDTNITVEDLRKIARNIVTLSRKFNIREGFGRKDDYMPQRAYSEDIIAPNGTKTKIDIDKYGIMLDEYYENRGWSKEGVPLD
jgi:aldehyde:ferredoxin oxidoreductase